MISATRTARQRKPGISATRTASQQLFTIRTARHRLQAWVYLQPEQQISATRTARQQISATRTARQRQHAWEYQQPGQPDSVSMLGDISNQDSQSAGICNQNSQTASACVGVSGPGQPAVQQQCFKTGVHGDLSNVLAVSRSAPDSSRTLLISAP